MSIEVKMSISFQNWHAPNFALLESKPGLKQDGIQPTPSIPVADLEANVVDALAASWLEDLYRKAGHRCPFTIIRAG